MIHLHFRASPEFAALFKRLAAEWAAKQDDPPTRPGAAFLRHLVRREAKRAGRT